MNRTGPVKRVTIWSRDIKRSLALYRGLPGLEIVEDKTLASPAILGMAGYQDGRMRMAHLAPARLCQADRQPEDARGPLFGDDLPRP